jgi:hypothetical protein
LCARMWLDRSDFKSKALCGECGNDEDHRVHKRSENPARHYILARK